MQHPVSELSERPIESGGITRYRPHSPENRPDIREWITILDQRKWSIVAIVALAVLLAVLASSRQTPIYKSETWVLVTPVEEGGVSGASIEPNLATEVRLAASVAVAEIVVEELDVPLRPRELLEDLTVGSPEETEIITFSYAHPDPAEAQSRAQAFSEAYLEYRRRTVVESVLESADSVQNELEALRARLDRLEADLVRLDEDDLRVSALESEAALLQGLILQRQLDRLSLGETFSTGRIVQPAALPTRPASPNHVLNGGLGLFGGLLAAVGLAFVQDRLSGPLRSEAEVEMYLGAPVLGTIPRIPAWRRRKQAFLAVRHDWGSPSAEAYRILRTNLLSSLVTAQGKTLIVTSAVSGEGKSATVANLGVAMARMGKKVIVVSADLRKPRLHSFFGLQPLSGVPEVLAGTALLDQALLRVPGGPSDPGLNNLLVLPSGTVPENSAELLGSPRMHQLLDQLAERADLVIIDTPPVLPVTDAQVLARLVDGVLIVIGPRSATKSSVESIRQQLAKVDAQVVGAILNGAEARRLSSYNY